jgi:hypothetical protein
MGQVTAFTCLHVALSLAGILSGLVVAFGMLNSKRLDCWTAIFLFTTVATSVTGFLFPFHRLMPSHVVGLISLVALSVTIFARYGRHLAGPWRRVYAAGAVFSLYLNFFVLIAQAFAKVPALKSTTPTQSEPPFLVAQGAALVIFLVLGIAATVRFRPAISEGAVPA